MEKQILNQKIDMFIFWIVLLIIGIQNIGYAELEFTEGDTTTREIEENTPASTNIGASLRYTAEGVNSCSRVILRGPDARAFDVERVFRCIQLKTKSALDYETKDSYEVKVIISASVGGSRDAITVTITVTDVNEAPMFAEASDGGNRIYRSIPENTAVGTNIGDPVSAIDPDGSEVALTYSLSGMNADMFGIDSTTGQLKTCAPLNYEAFGNEPRAYLVSVRVFDGTMDAEMEVSIAVEPVNEFAPMFIEGDAATREIHEKEEVGANIGVPVSATDMDIGETLEYNLTDADLDVFEIDSGTGQLRTKAALDYQTKPAHTVKVVVSDGTRIDSILVTINVLADVVEVPDASLARTIRRKLGLGSRADITKKAMLELTTLNASRRAPEINSITGLEHATNLTTLLLDYNSINDITPLTGLTNLTTLHIEGNRVDRIMPLAGLTNLTTLHLSDNRIGRIEPLAGLTNLTELLLGFNRLDDLSPLASLTNLTTLHLAENYIENLTPLAGLTNLTELHLQYNRRLTDISPLAELVNLETLKLEGCPIEDFTPLADLTATIDVLAGSAPAANRNGINVFLDPVVLKKLDRKALQGLLQRLHTVSDGSLKYRQAIVLIEKVLASKRPNKTTLLANYPNPFNPETWIPYHLAHGSDVRIDIFDTHGTVIRHLELGHQSAGYYTNRNDAAYWDGLNDSGEHVTTGIYFYQLQADNVSPMRKMVILK